MTDRESTPDRPELPLRVPGAGLHPEQPSAELLARAAHGWGLFLSRCADADAERDGRGGSAEECDR
ncbi:hypothetical protein [Streptomyces alkaliterrae]|uniref:Uncharacterized protein n=1 Tax=Streptomyces alkaliterrae TaxID=2213162 RepID=A0A5P0YPA4_9ACTN|nr:hypothetical protein [Streptomyces alkaliterrae]MBB1253142.1 hypothetical protein [Streptomyces alkaliterrae]MBB1259353.1 hypothetical protein [Streptomyces alkaliterrae]MQS01730.1 hypothetical protein [Streptomyces alkaliterrae]